jgi:hypothetical protein
MLSRKKGKRYGEGHQKALQISIGMLPRARVSLLEGAIGLPSLRYKCNAWHLFVRVCSFLLLGERFSSHTTAREIDDGLSGHEAAEISAPTLLLRWKPCHWEEPRSPINSAMQWRRTHGLPHCAERVVKTATLWGGRCSFDTSPPVAIRGAVCYWEYLTSQRYVVYSPEKNGRSLGAYIS